MSAVIDHRLPSNVAPFELAGAPASFDDEHVPHRVPLPAGIALFGVGILSLALWRGANQRRR